MAQCHARHKDTLIRCDKGSGHDAVNEANPQGLQHSVTTTWGDDECYDPTEPGYAFSEVPKVPVEALPVQPDIEGCAVPQCGHPQQAHQEEGCTVMHIESGEVVACGCRTYI